MLARCLTLTLLLCIGVLSLTPDREYPGDSAFVWLVHFTPTLTQKLLHVGMYACLTVAFSWSFRRFDSVKARLALALVAAVTFGAAMEWLQTFVPGRFGSLTDVLLNSVGALIGLAVCEVVRRRKRHSPLNS